MLKLHLVSFLQIQLRRWHFKEEDGLDKVHEGQILAGFRLDQLTSSFFQNARISNFLF